MSAYSEIQGYFPAGSVMQLTNDQKLYAKPPFIQDGKVLWYNFNFFRIQGFD